MELRIRSFDNLSTHPANLDQRKTFCEKHFLNEILV